MPLPLIKLYNIELLCDYTEPHDLMFVSVLAASLTAELEAYFVPQHLHLYRSIQVEVIDLSVHSTGKKGSSRLGQTATLRPAASTEMLGRGKTVTLSPGFRSITPQPLVTQHNKNAILQQQAALAR